MELISKWLARIIVDDKQKYIGRFADEGVAAKALSGAVKTGLASTPKILQKTSKKLKATAMPNA